MGNYSLRGSAKIFLVPLVDFGNLNTIAGTLNSAISIDELASRLVQTAV